MQVVYTIRISFIFYRNLQIRTVSRNDAFAISYNSQRSRPTSAHNHSQEKRRQRQWAIYNLHGANLSLENDHTHSANQRREFSCSIFHKLSGITSSGGGFEAQGN